MDDEKSLREAVIKAAHVILSGGLVAFPTESFYGLGVNATDAGAVERLFKLKKRAADHPILVLLPSLTQLTEYVVHISDTALKLIEKFWPGGLTLVFEASPKLSPLLTAGTGKIGIRISGHPIAGVLARMVGRPITGTSANISGRPACNTPEEVSHSLGKAVDMILDGGRTAGGKGSTVLDVTVNPPRILREGIVGRER
ncbi:MAG: L-threonylcarbamoyladenylate synthase, partial [Pseudomonadota bacterium]